jgi:nucleotide-binding universal stress UspA family protein
MVNGPSTDEPRIIVGVDGSGPSHDALRWAGYFSAIMGARLEVVTAWEYPPSFGWAAIAPEWDPVGDMTKVLEQGVAVVFGDRPPEGMALQVLEGGAAKVLIDASHGATMLVVGSRGHGGFAGLLLGSVSANVAEHAKCPVFIVHGKQAPPPVFPVLADA